MTNNDYNNDLVMPGSGRSWSLGDPSSKKIIQGVDQKKLSHRSKLFNLDYGKAFHQKLFQFSLLLFRIARLLSLLAHLLNLRYLGNKFI